MYGRYGNSAAQQKQHTTNNAARRKSIPIKHWKPYSTRP